MIINTHTHINDWMYSEEEKLDILKKCEEMEIISIISGFDLKSSIEALRLARMSDNVYVNLGIHPEYANKYKESDLEEIDRLISNNLDKVVAVGEAGLDYYYTKDYKEEQKELFIKQIELANKHNLPIVVHSRDAAEDTLKLLKEHKVKKTGLMHCYQYSLEMAELFVKEGYILSIGGVITFKNAHSLKRVVEGIDLKHLVLETDCPYLTPVPHRGKRNYSYYVTYVLDEIVKIKDMDKDEVIRKTNENVDRVFGVK